MLNLLIFVLSVWGEEEYYEYMQLYLDPVFQVWKQGKAISGKE